MSKMAYTIEVVKDACLVLELFLSNDQPLSLAEITKQIGLNKGKVFRILATLEESRFISRTSSGNYWLHVHFLEFGRQILSHLDIVDIASPVLDWLCSETGESAFLSIVDGKEALCIAARESSLPIRLSAKVGRRLPLYAGSTPVILLAYLPEDRRQKLLDSIELKPFTPNTITNRTELNIYLEKIRNQGYVVTGEDLDVGARGVAAPIRDLHGQVVASISVSGVSSRFTEERVKCYIQVILDGANTISKALGYNPAS